MGCSGRCCTMTQHHGSVLEGSTAKPGCMPISLLIKQSLTKQ